MKVLHDMHWWEMFIVGVGLGAGSDLADFIIKTFLK